MKVLLFLLILTAVAGAGTCTGKDPCKECASCKRCAYCNSGKGSCNVARQQADREYEARKKKAASPR